MQPRFVGRAGPADAVTAANASLGLVAIAVAPENLELAARLVLLAAILDGLDGIVARRFGGSEIGPYLDSLADVASFAVAPAALVYFAIAHQWQLSSMEGSVELVVTLGILAIFVAMAVIRLAMYTAFDTGTNYTEGVQSTLAATVIGAAILATVNDPVFLLAAMAVFSYLMVSPIRYPDLLARDALIMGAVHAGAVIAPLAFGRALPYALLFLGLGYLLFGPWLYWRDGWVVLELKGNA